jgi:hypothetical protein
MSMVFLMLQEAVQEAECSFELQKTNSCNIRLCICTTSGGRRVVSLGPLTKMLIHRWTRINVFLLPISPPVDGLTKDSSHKPTDPFTYVISCNTDCLCMWYPAILIVYVCDILQYWLSMYVISCNTDCLWAPTSEFHVQTIMYIL